MPEPIKFELTLLEYIGSKVKRPNSTTSTTSKITYTTSKYGSNTALHLKKD